MRVCHCVQMRVWIRKPRDGCHTFATKPPATHAVQTGETLWILRCTAQEADRPAPHVRAASRDGGWKRFAIEQWHGARPLDRMIRQDQRDQQDARVPLRPNTRVNTDSRVMGATRWPPSRRPRTQCRPGVTFSRDRAQASRVSARGASR
jgi:hypothetical protein